MQPPLELIPAQVHHSGRAGRVSCGSKRRLSTEVATLGKTPISDLRADISILTKS